jgi:hypothetical protein
VLAIVVVLPVVGATDVTVRTAVKVVRVRVELVDVPADIAMDVAIRALVEVVEEVVEGGGAG